MYRSKGQAIFWGIICGSLITAFGIYKYFETQSFFAGAKETTAIIISVSNKTESSTEDGQKSYHKKFTARYEYTVNGKTHTDDEITTGQTFEDSKYSKGDILKIYYDPANPQDNRFKTEAQWLPVAGILLGLFVIGAGIYTLKTKRYLKS
ncbi:MAG: hypothetical protein K0S44_130 [Bacteroidetes bacterium]|jgi:hypothetical protein|nr:hypothetical protein [Bacteroidota bacterium]